HEERFGVVHSVIYDVLVPREGSLLGSEYLVRIINRSTETHVPFVQADVQALRKICRRATSLLEDARTALHLSHIITLSGLAVRDLKTFIQEFAAAISVEGLHHAVVLSRTIESRDTIDFVRVLGDVHFDVDTGPQSQEPHELDGAPLRWQQVAGNLRGDKFES